MLDESSRATAPAPQKPSLARAGSSTKCHLAMIRARNDFKQVPFRLAIRLNDQEPLYGPGRWSGFPICSTLRASCRVVFSSTPSTKVVTGDPGVEEKTT